MRPHTEPGRPTEDNTDQPDDSSRPAPLSKGQRALAAVCAVGAPALAILGGRGSYLAVHDEAIRRGVDTDLAALVPIVTDLSIVVLAATDILLTWRGLPLTLVRACLWVLTSATIGFNLAAGHGDPVAAAMHATMPIVLIIWVEAVRLALRRSQHSSRGGTLRDSIPLARWALAPISTTRMWRRMILWNQTSYQHAVETEMVRGRIINRLRAQHGKNWRHQAGADLVWALRTGVSIVQPPHAAEHQLSALAFTSHRSQAQAGFPGDLQTIDPSEHPNGAAEHVDSQADPCEQDEPAIIWKYMTDDQLLEDMLQRWSKTPSRDRVRVVYGVGSPRASRLRASFDDCRATTQTPEFRPTDGSGSTADWS